MDPQSIKVKKASGEYQFFSEEKIRSSLARAGADRDLIDQVLIHLGSKLYQGITTKKIYEEVYSLLEELQHPLYSRYNLKEAIMSLGPSGYPFERFFAGLLDSQGYQTELNQVVEGHCVSHETDVLASKNNQYFFIECKYHNRRGTKTEIKSALYTYARFLDLTESQVMIKGKKGKASQAWLVTNTKVTNDVKKYAGCIGLKIVSWDYPATFNVRGLIELL